MKRSVVRALLLCSGVAACTGPQGATGKPGQDGDPGMVTASVSAVTPPYAFLGRTVDLQIVGDNTSWTSAAKVSFAASGITVNKVTAGSATGLLVNVSIAADAALGSTNVTVTEGSASSALTGAFEIKTPIAVTSDQASGLPQGGFANVHVSMLDVTTPFDPTTTSVSFSASDVTAAGSTTVADFAAVTRAGADVLATASEMVDVVVTTGATGTAVTSTAKNALQVVARAPLTLSSSTPSTGTVATTADSALFAFTPAAASARFVQLTLSSPGTGGALGLAVPKSGKLAAALGSFAVRFGLATDSTDVTYVIVADGSATHGSPPPYGFTLGVVETPCTVFSETGIHTSSTTAFSLSTVPALAQADFGNGTNTAGDWYGFTVAAGATTIHAATGGDGKSDLTVTIYGSDGSTVLAKSLEDGPHKDVLATGVTTPGTYFAAVTAGPSFDPAHSTYDLFVDVH